VKALYSRRFAAIGTVVEIRVVAGKTGRLSRRNVEHLIDAAAGWFDRVERDCSRFDPSSELRRLCARVGEAVAVSPLLYSAVHFALAVAAETDGAFDPTIGARMEALGFDRHHRTGEQTRTEGEDVTWRDVSFDLDGQTVMLHRPLTLDLGAVAKGLAIDLAARELAPLENFAVDAGGDLFLGGVNEIGTPWTVGIRHPRGGEAPIASVRVSNAAVCTSGDYERRSASGDHHLMDPRTGQSTRGISSVTTIGDSAMVADALGTAAFVLGAAEGIALLQRHELEGMIVDDAQRVTESDGWSRYVA
jgi:FAD:protein FMN transferase